MDDMLGEKGRGLRRGVEGALEMIHKAGVVQGDVKWRNIMVLENEDGRQDETSERRVVWLDFSNAVTADDPIEEGVCEVKTEEEMGRLREMLTRHEVCLTLSPYITHSLSQKLGLLTC